MRKCFIKMVNIEINYNAIGARIRAQRKKMNMTQEKLAEAAGLAPNHISNIETGSTKLSLPALLQIAVILKTDVNSLLYDNLPTLVETYDEDAKLILADCTKKERLFLLDLLGNGKLTLRKHGL